MRALPLTQPAISPAPRFRAGALPLPHSGSVLHPDKIDCYTPDQTLQRLSVGGYSRPTPYKKAIDLPILRTCAISFQHIVGAERLQHWVRYSPNRNKKGALLRRLGKSLGIPTLLHRESNTTKKSDIAFIIHSHLSLKSSICTERIEAGNSVRP